jgi:hypothetical protein
MKQFAALLIALSLTSGCETVWIVPPATGRVVDSISRKPIAQADVTRVCDDVQANTKSDAAGCFKFRGKRTIGFAIGDTMSQQITYYVVATGYQVFRTNRIGFGMANQSGLRHDLGNIAMTPSHSLESFRFIGPSTTMQQVFAALGPPYRDVGSGIYMYEYELADGTQIWIGSADDTNIIYVRHGTTKLDDSQVLYQRK